jgi:hypothetical protein
MDHVNAYPVAMPAGNQAQAYQSKLNEKQTEMASLSSLLGDNRRRLRDLLATIEDRLQRFAPMPESASTDDPTPPEPQPGTLTGLQYVARRTAEDIGRLDAICMRLRDLL